MNRIKELRESKGMTQIRLSIELSLSQETVSAYENGKHYPSVENLIKMSKIFMQVAIIYLVYLILKLLFQQENIQKMRFY